MSETAHSEGPAPWRQFVMEPGPLDPAEVETILARHGAQSITWSDAGDDPQLEPMAGETPLWQHSRVTGLFPEATDFDALLGDLAAATGTGDAPDHAIVDLPDRDWEREWLRHFEPMSFGSRLWIVPGPADVPAAAPVVLRLDPGLAFGTGTHATTALCLEWLDGLDLEGLRVLDYGCGSGVLGIAALLLGAGRVTALDIDAQAVTATSLNARRNGVADRMFVTDDPGSLEGRFDVVIANILAGPLVELAGSISARVGPGCLLALSGILSGQIDEVCRAYAPWIDFEAPAMRQQDGQTWARLTGRRKQG